MSGNKNKLKHISENIYYPPPLGSTKEEAFSYVPQKRILGITSSHSLHLIIWRFPRHPSPHPIHHHPEGLIYQIRESGEGILTLAYSCLFFLLRTVWEV